MAGRQGHYLLVRGPGTDWLKPDITAPGLHILAGTTPTPESPEQGPPGEPLPVDRGDFDVVAPRGRLGGSGCRIAPNLDARSDQVGADDDRRA